MAIHLVALVLILITNGFFAASEVALVSVRQSRLREMAATGHVGAQSALSLLANPGRLLSVTQVGVTLASLGLGWAGEDTLYGILLALFTPLGVHVQPALLHAAAFTLAFLAISYAHVIIGEVVPKNLALEKADRIAVLVAPALLIFYRISQPFVFVVERTAAVILRSLGLSSSHSRGGHTPEELKYIIQSIRREGRLQQFEEEAIERLIELSDLSAREIMTPRHNMVALPVDATFDVVLRVMTEGQFTRMPVFEGRREHVIGIVHYKDLMRTWEERRAGSERRSASRSFQLRRYIRKPTVVPETKPLNQLIGEFRSNHTRMAIVVDEFGTVSGLITLDDVLKQVFGEIGDEHDAVQPAPPDQDQALRLVGSTTIRDLQTRYEILLPADAGFETLAGFLLYQFGYIPRNGESIEYDGRRFTITEMDRNRVAKVLVERVAGGKSAEVSEDRKREQDATL